MTCRDNVSSGQEQYFILRIAIGNGYIPTSALKEILHELDPKLSDAELEGIIDEIDGDGSGTVDFQGMNKPKAKRYFLL